ncbi:hypothetical protein, unlikely [Trypanosoma brucei gambiense DAL972]|uniref:Uncharacterized protein n=1 Tax=Trypanosoma brucei gambiense (strain MHOM/CI/86/DAL972) TaxID=679716 RepID=C9ZPL0_TRYB9|nr:hypothetical protein, unlikely [Trypanosoma brucei gambiense DAL972]CBH11338.1 hypothetical protein, unlikely [Trypanosoma brucei gambiense DAL972]|eukprot:XP_011773625.1 hypothetical protein, unlikely [Trypanosoma brucei gambiense DAL972]
MLTRGSPLPLPGLLTVTSSVTLVIYIYIFVTDGCARFLATSINPCHLAVFVIMVCENPWLIFCLCCLRIILLFPNRRGLRYPVLPSFPPSPLAVTAPPFNFLFRFINAFRITDVMFGVVLYSFPSTCR